MPTALEIGKAWTAHQAYNKHAQKDRIKDFDLRRWLNVVHALNGKAKAPKATLGLKGTGPYERKDSKRSKKAWTDLQRARFEATIAERKRGR